MERKFRRPAMLDPEAAEEIVGDEDPAEESELAHATAWALMGVPAGDFDAQDVEKVKEAVRAKGVSIVAGTWARSPEFTLPGAFWRIYLLWQWYQLDAETIEKRYSDGLTAMQDRGLTEGQWIPPLPEVLRGVEGVLAGYASEDNLASVFESVAQTMRVLASGVRYGDTWITDDAHELAHHVTRRPVALTATAKELDESAAQAAAGQLE